jgi:hypothetical protein
VIPAGQVVSQPAMPAWMEVLNNILKKLGHERPAPDHDNRGGGVSSEPELTGVWAPSMDETGPAWEPRWEPHG